MLRKGNHLEQREKLGLSSAPKGQSNGRAPHPEPTNAMQKVEVCVYNIILTDLAFIDVKHDKWTCKKLVCSFSKSSFNLRHQV